jgi:hypothetical protein
MWEGRGLFCFLMYIGSLICSVVGREGHGESEMEMWIRRKISIITL